MQMKKYMQVFLMVFFVGLLSACISTTKLESTGEYLDDSVLTTKVKAAILNAPGLKSSEINVETFKNVVQLSGFVSSEADAALAMRTAASVQGVRSVKNDMRIK